MTGQDLGGGAAAVAQALLDALDRAARYYREALKHVIEECGNDRPRIDHIRETAERGIRAADHELALTDDERPF